MRKAIILFIVLFLISGISIAKETYKADETEGKVQLNDDTLVLQDGSAFTGKGTYENGVLTMEDGALTLKGGSIFSGKGTYSNDVLDIGKGTFDGVGMENANNVKSESGAIVGTADENCLVKGIKFDKGIEFRYSESTDKDRIDIGRATINLDPTVDYAGSSVSKNRATNSLEVKGDIEVELTDNSYVDLEEGDRFIVKPNGGVITIQKPEQMIQSQGYLRLDSKGEKVEQLQKRLNELGYNVDIDGKFGPQTESAVKQFQAQHNLGIDGVVGSETTGALNSIPKVTIEGDGMIKNGGYDVGILDGKILLPTKKREEFGEVPINLGIKEENDKITNIRFRKNKNAPLAIAKEGKSVVRIITDQPEGSSIGKSFIDIPSISEVENNKELLSEIKPIIQRIKEDKELSQQDKIVEIAELLHKTYDNTGLGYDWGADATEDIDDFDGTKTKGIDCSGYAYSVYYLLDPNLDISKQRTTAVAQSGKGKKIDIPKDFKSFETANLKKGDLIFIGKKTKRVSHVLIYAGNDRFKHSSTNRVDINGKSGKGINEIDLASFRKYGDRGFEIYSANRYISE